MTLLGGLLPFCSRRSLPPFPPIELRARARIPLLPPLSTPARRLHIEDIEPASQLQVFQETVTNCTLQTVKLRARINQPQALQETGRINFNILHILEKILDDVP
ncbi:hypothetical protein OS493_023098 [Desmophyllum pertusum]|uniref:Uncharacterized protein n=1 Tax=Desmophyllum pertusum TaxID=174260 RepID=A0A9X0CQB9_9CNID|nr:hypothetical protein OS493_023098 [Desmophyllum pertusum]